MLGFGIRVDAPCAEVSVINIKVWGSQFWGCIGATTLREGTENPSNRRLGSIHLNLNELWVWGHLNLNGLRYVTPLRLGTWTQAGFSGAMTFLMFVACLTLPARYRGSPKQGHKL